MGSPLSFAVPSLIVLAGLAGCSRPDAPASAKPVASAARPIVRFQTDWYPQTEHGGFYQAQAQGFYAEAGIDVEILPGGPGATVPQKLVAGIADIGMARSDDVMLWVQENLPVVMVAAFMQHDPQAILVHDESPVNSFADLNGRRVMATPGTAWEKYVKARYGIEFAVVPMNYGIAQFMSDRTFIQQCFVTNEPFYVRKHGGKPRTLLIASAGYDPYRVVFTTRTFLREHPEQVRAFVAASLRGWTEFVSGDPAPGKRLIRAGNDKMDDDFMAYSLSVLRDLRLVAGDSTKGEGVGVLSGDRLQAHADLLLELKILRQPLRVDAFARFDFLPSRAAVSGR